MDWSTGRMGFLKCITRSFRYSHFGCGALESKRFSINEQSEEVLMITRRAFIAAALAAPAMPVGSALAQAVKEPGKQADFLFVQTAKSMTFDKSTNKLNLDSVSSTTVFFTDRPERIAGNMK